jgi:hypothetical protein
MTLKFAGGFASILSTVLIWGGFKVHKNDLGFLYLDIFISGDVHLYSTSVTHSLGRLLYL